MPDSTFKRSSAADPARMEHIRDLLGRYPDIDHSEKQKILRFLKKGPPLDAALLTTDEQVRPKLARFRDDHPGHFGLDVKHYAFTAALLAVLVLLSILLWDSGLG